MMEPWAFDTEAQEWVPVSRLPPSHVRSKGDTAQGCGELSVITLNCLFDEWRGVPYKPSVVCSMKRFEHISKILKEKNADIVTMNEITATSLEFFEKQEWVRQGYWICGRDSLGGFPPFGNAILSKSEPLHAFSVKPRGLKRPIVVAGFDLPFEEERTIRLGLAATHLTAGSQRRKRRRKQLVELEQELMQEVHGFEAIIIQGDLNFHSEKENENIPPGFVDVWLEEVDSLENSPGYTFDALRNPMIARMWPLGNEHRRMRLDRVFLSARETQLVCKEMSIQFDKLVYSEEYPAGAPTFMDKATEVMALVTEMVGMDPRRQPEKYLMCSDHFGIQYTLTLKD